MKNSNPAYVPLRRSLGTRILDWLASEAEKTAKRKKENPRADTGDSVLRAFNESMEKHRRAVAEDAEYRRRF